MLRLFVLIGVLAGSQSSFAQSIFKGPSQPITNRTRSGKTPETPPFGLSDFRVVAGTSYLVAAISNHGEPRGSGKSSFSSPASGIRPGSVANYVFFDTKDDSAISLLPDNKSLIVSLDAYSDAAVLTHYQGGSGRSIELASAEDAMSHEQAHRVRWHIVELITTDTDADGELTTKDRRGLGVADAGGRGFAEVIPNLGEVFSRELLDANTLLVIHGNQTNQVAVRIDLARRKIISNKPLPNFGTR